MSEFNIEVQGGSSVRLPTAGKYCEKDIIVTASGGGEEFVGIKHIDLSGEYNGTRGKASDHHANYVGKAQVRGNQAPNSAWNQKPNN